MLGGSVEVLSGMINEHKLKNVYLFDKTRLKYLDEQCKAMKMKLKCVHG